MRWPDLDFEQLVDHAAVDRDEDASLPAVVEDEGAREEPHVDSLRVLTFLGVTHLIIVSIQYQKLKNSVVACIKPF